MERSGGVGVEGWGYPLGDGSEERKCKMGSGWGADQVGDEDWVVKKD